MKKSIRILAMLMVAAMLCSMLPVSAFAAGATSAAGNVYYTGADYTSDTVAIDGVISAEDGYVDLTPNGVPLTLVNETLEMERWGGDLPTTFTLAEPKAEHAAVGLTTETIVVKYYVAQDNDNVYLAIEETMPEKAYTVDSVAYNTGKYLFNNLKLGFNAADPTQQIDFVSDGFWAVQDGASGTKWDVTYTASWTEHPFIVTGLSDTEEFVSKKGPATEIVADYVDEAGAPKDSIMNVVKGQADGMVTRTYELKLNKAGIEAAYADVFGATDIGFDSMFVVMSSTDYEWANEADNYSLLFVTGTVNDGNLISDKVVFGDEEPEAPAYPGNVFYTGDNYTSDTVVLDGAMAENEGYVCVTPDFVDRLGLDSNDGNGYSYGYSALEEIDVSEYATQMKYYVAQDDENVYLLIEDYAPFVDQNNNGTFDYYYESILRNQIYNINVGFDAENYERAVYFRMNGSTITSKIVGADGVNKDLPAGTIESSFARYGSAEPNASVLSNSNNNTVNQTANTWLRLWVARFEIKINKALVEEAYASLDDSKNTDFDFSEMFLNVATRFVGYNGDGGNTRAGWAVYGGYLNETDAKAAGLPTSYIPNTIIFGAEEVPEEPVEPETPAGLVVDGYKTVVSDGAIGADEYTTTVDLSPVAYSNYVGFGTLTEDALGFDDLVSEEMSISFAHDANKIYVGVYDKTGTATIRNGYVLRFGFDEANPQNYVGIYLQCVKFDGTDGSKTTVANELRYDDSSTYPQAGYRGITKSNGTYEWQAVSASGDGFTRFKYSADTAAVYPVTAMKVVKEDVDGDIELGAYGRINSGQHYVYYEIEFDKELLLNFFNEMYADGEGVEDLNTMLFSVQQRDANGSKINVMWNGSFDEEALATAEHAMEAYSFDKVTFTAPAVEEHVHTPIVDAAVAATCTENGLTEGSHCACGEVLVAQEVVPATGHTEEDVAAVAPTCTETGLTAGKICSVCEETIVAQTVVDATGHAFDDDADATCNNCDYVREVESTDDTTDVADDTTEPADDTTEPAEVTTEPATTEPATEEVTTKAPETTAPVEEKKGCGSSVSVAGLALVAALGTCTVFVAKKKED